MTERPTRQRPKNVDLSFNPLIAGPGALLEKGPTPSFLAERAAPRPDDTEFMSETAHS